MSDSDAAVALLIQRGLGKPQTRTYCRTCMEGRDKCSRDGRCPNPTYVTQGRYVFETEWREVSQ